MSGQTTATNPLNDERIADLAMIEAHRLAQFLCESADETRQEILQELFPQGVPDSVQKLLRIYDSRKITLQRLDLVAYDVGMFLEEHQLRIGEIASRGALALFAVVFATAVLASCFYLGVDVESLLSTESSTDNVTAYVNEALVALVAAPAVTMSFLLVGSAGGLNRCAGELEKLRAKRSSLEKTEASLAAGMEKIVPLAVKALQKPIAEQIKKSIAGDAAASPASAKPAP